MKLGIKVSLLLAFALVLLMGVSSYRTFVPKYKEGTCLAVPTKDRPKIEDIVRIKIVENNIVEGKTIVDMDFEFVLVQTEVSMEYIRALDSIEVLCE
jgi:hypothetical protein